MEHDYSGLQKQLSLLLILKVSMKRKLWRVS